METALKTIPAVAVLASALAAPLQAAVTVYTDRTAWEAGVAARGWNHFEGQDFESETPGYTLGYFGVLDITVIGDQGVNAISDSNRLTAPYFTYEAKISPNGSNYYLGQAGDPLSENPNGDQSLPILSFWDLDRSVPAFGADWTFYNPYPGNNISMLIDGNLISFSDYLTPNTEDANLLDGFLGIITDPPLPTFSDPLKAAFIGEGFFGMDNVTMVGVVPVPAAVWLFGSGLVGLGALAGRKRISSGA